jgi:signal transduction histidine kinase
MYGFAVFCFIVYKALEIFFVTLTSVHFSKIKDGAERLSEGILDKPVDTTGMKFFMKDFGDDINRISDGVSLVVNNQMKSERMKTELITNVSHDIKTPLTSIINYVDLLEKEDIEGEKAKEYMDVISRQSIRLKKLIEDLIEASKAQSGALEVNMDKIDPGVLLTQAVGEYADKLEAANVELVLNKPEAEMHIMADGRHLFRVFANLLGNISKYAQSGTRAYVDLNVRDGKAIMEFKNISHEQLNISGDELMERFVRGDESRTTEGNGLGLSIARSLTELMKGTMDLSVDGDLFKVTLTFATE